MPRFVLIIILTLAGGSLCVTPSMAAEADWPARPLHLIVPLPAGSAADVVARVLGDRLSARLGQPVVIENRAGASGTIGTLSIARADPDGYTLGIATSTTLITAALLDAKLPYDPVKDFALITLVGITPYLLVVNPKVPAKTVADVIVLAKSKPRSLSYSSVGNASLAHFAGELFAARAGIELNHVPYRSSTQAVIDLLEGRIDMQFGIAGTSLQFIREGKLHALASATKRRLEELPDVPTMIEAGLPGYDVSLLFGVIAPVAIPPVVIARLNRELGEILAMDDVKRAFATQAIYARSSTPDQLRERVAKETAQWREVAAKADIKPE
jgi:tripartite-type tricarboxylate transporter receptor subunit TctC